MAENLDIAFASDNNYIQHLAVAIRSLVENNLDFETIQIHVLSNGISAENKTKLEKTIERFRAKLNYYELAVLLDDIQNKYNIPATISISSYARLFLSSILPSSVSKIIYADCDTLFLGSLYPLWQMPFSNNSVFGVLDHVGNQNKIGIGLPPDFQYINAGFLYINIANWRTTDALLRMTNFIKEMNGIVLHNDQGVINGIFKDEICTIDLKHNVMTSFFEFQNVEEIKAYYGVSKYYSEKEIQEAKQNPIMVHFTQGFSKRPWIEGSKHPLKHKYWEFLDKTPFKEAQSEKDKRQIKHKIIENLFWMVGPKWYKKIFVK